MRLQFIVSILMIFLVNCVRQQLLYKTQKPTNSKYIPNETSILKRCGPSAIICDSVDNYPMDLVNRTLRERPNHVRDLLQRNDLTDKPIRTSFGHEDGDPVRGDTELCRSRMKIIFPQAGQTNDNVWKYIFNTGEYGVEAVYCLNPEGDCAITFAGFFMTCKQKYIYKTLISIIHTSGSMANDQFKVPSGCVCKYKSVYNEI